MRASIESRRGVVFSTGGDGFAAAFWTPDEAVDAAAAAQSLLQSEVWPDGVAIAVRMGVHTGVASERDGDYFGPMLNRAARIMAVGHGGQVLISDATRGSCRGRTCLWAHSHKPPDDLTIYRSINAIAESFFASLKRELVDDEHFLT